MTRAPFRKSLMLPCLAAVLLLGGMPDTAAQDEVTPSGARTVDTATEPTTGSALISYDEAAAQLTEVIPVNLDSMAQVAQNSYNWTGPADASMQCEIGMTPAALIIRGEIRDDHPFHQTMLRPAAPDWWRITYGADGLEFHLDDPTSAAKQVRIALNFGSRAVDPQIELLKSPLGGSPRFITSADFRVFTPETVKDPLERQTRFQFEAAIPISELAEARMLAGPLRITVRLHDMDGGPSTYLMMQQVLERKAR